MKRIITTALAVCLVFGLATAEAGQKTKKERKAPPEGARTEKTEEMKKPVPFDDFPRMSFTSGTLNQSGMRGWRVGDLNLILKKDCPVVSENGERTSLWDGRTAIVMGSRVGDTIVAWSIRVMAPDQQSKPGNPGNVTDEPGPNPNVGVYSAPLD